ncbi:hypothetical protein LTR56_003831 [Elasticomyces elasticus]|nr:hypothetical protein LTR22_013108 [Elasticomyces elasticus]KAK3654973.1 hypothetical protein LTR56_003831 [Elasticomyces elasticus]KAK4928695.1 hypothetical protein LTR49_004504 [Elasticomyces elasticus]KAK5766677.1 hypothetical protein LTS12_003296 [Elasticomyces elasticus]
MAELRKLDAEMPAAATPDDMAAVMAAGLIALQGSIIPGLRSVLETRERAIQMYGPRRAVSVTKPCAECGKMRWGGPWEDELDWIRMCGRPGPRPSYGSRCGGVDYSGLFREY